LQPALDKPEGHGILQMIMDSDKTDRPKISYRQQGIDRIEEERTRQFEKWGKQDHDMMTWLAILHEETGELAQACLHNKFGGPAEGNILEEAVQVAAVGLQIVEFILEQEDIERAERREKLKDTRFADWCQKVQDEDAESGVCGIVRDIQENSEKWEEEVAANEKEIAKQLQDNINGQIEKAILSGLLDGWDRDRGMEYEQGVRRNWGWS
jgi:NTP pyrophosphatase (non-canonical NTP hydrolase)